MDEAITLTINDAGEITSVDWRAFLLQELETPATRDMVAQTYSYIIRSGQTNVREVNLAIIERWSPAGLRYIKEKAWKIVNKDRASVA